MPVDEVVTDSISRFFPQDRPARVAWDQASDGKGDKQNAEQCRETGKDAADNECGHDE